MCRASRKHYCPPSAALGRDLAAANRELRGGSRPNQDPATRLVAAQVAQDLGQFQQTIEYCRRAQLRDPRFQALPRRLKLPQQACLSFGCDWPILNCGKAD